MTQFLVFLTYLSITLVLYTYIIYPFLLWLITRLYKRPTQLGNEALTVSLIIAAYNEAYIIGEKVKNSFELNYPQDKLQIIVVADGSSDNTADIAREAGQGKILVLHNPPRQGKSAALNRAVEQATGEILVFSDANAMYLTDTLTAIVQHFNDPEVGQVSGKKTVRSGESSIGDSEGAYWKYESLIKRKESLIFSTVGVSGEINAIRKNLYHPIPQHIINDDAYLAMRTMKMGKRIIYEPQAISWETSALSIDDEIARRKRINSGRYQLMFMINLWCFNDIRTLLMMISHKFFRLLLPFFMIFALIFNILAVFSGARGLIILTLIGQILVYALAYWGYLLDKSGKKNKIAKLVFFIVRSNIASLEGFKGFLTKRQSVLWEKVQRG